MEYFLENIARSIYTQFGNTLNRHCLVFPNRRAGLYLLKYLASMILKPVWVPAVYTVNDLFRSYSSLKIASNEILLFELFKIYRGLRKTPESFDDFYFWGDMLLDDFDDVDKYLVDAEMLFSNVLDIKNIDQQFGGLTEAQKEIIKRFWVNLDPENLTHEKSDFISIWSILNALYHSFRESLFNQDLAYEGMIFRELAENQKDDLYEGTEWEMIHFIGFNALNECEKRVMQKFQKAGKARFYWDYDNSYIKDGSLNSAGYFIRQNLKIFGNDMPEDWKYDTMLTSESSFLKRRVLETSSDTAQVKLIPDLIKQLPDLTEETAHHTAIVLADENLLMPVLTSLPEDAGDINITMGYPLKHTLVYSLMRHLMDLQRYALVTKESVLFGYKYVTNILKHSLINDFLSESDIGILNEITSSNLIWVSSDRFSDSPCLKPLFEKQENSALLSGYFKKILVFVAGGNGQMSDSRDRSGTTQNIRNEFIYRTILSVNRLDSIVSGGEVNFSPGTYMRILDRLLKNQSVPFSGEPLSGIQIMGLLETRVLDFRNLIILSVNEGVMPKFSTGSSFIPFSLREAFGLPSINHQESVYAYHFYRLLQRAENVTFLYNSNSEGLKSGEMSRFLIQMKYDPVMKPEFIDVNFEVKSHMSVPEIVERSETHVRLLNSRFIENSGHSVLSPSAINMWLNCRMKFYYRYVNGLKEPDVVSKDIDPAMLGEILHDVMKDLYYPYINQIVTPQMLDLLIRNQQYLDVTIKKIIDGKFSGAGSVEAQGNELIIQDVLISYIRKVLSLDRSSAPFKILHLETNFDFPLSLISGNSPVIVRIGGKIDRIDTLNGVTRIVDYKTGSVADRINSIEELFENDRKKDGDAWLQTLLYCEVFLANTPGITLRPSVYKVKKLSGSSSDDRLRVKINTGADFPVDDYKEVREEFLINLNGTIGDIFSSDIPFMMTDDRRGKCSYCAYRGLCNR